MHSTWECPVWAVSSVIPSNSQSKILEHQKSLHACFVTLTLATQWGKSKSGEKMGTSVSIRIPTATVGTRLAKEDHRMEWTDEVMLWIWRGAWTRKSEEPTTPEVVGDSTTEETSHKTDSKMNPSIGEEGCQITTKAQEEEHSVISRTQEVLLIETTWHLTRL